ncbi:MAG: hypothetical protein WBJ10_09260, partial [Daejeonella sp.]|uniref:hypothetical protein n=1 Tax=Daejeonella sp. TaxID=2805397 RepID=UPI003C73EC80
MPVKVSGEVSGMIYAKNDDHKGQGRILINFFRNGKPAGRTLSETDGFFSYLGLPPGNYTAEVDSAQLSQLKASAKPASFSFNIAPLLEGDVVSEVEFKLQDADYMRPPLIDLTPARTANVVITGLKASHIVPKFINFPDNRQKSRSYKPAKTLIYNYLIIANAFGDKSQSALIQKTLSNRYGYPVKVNPSGSLSYQIVIEGFETK